ncbi:hypothetical protein HYT25_04875 [Candidatus Pacearchaeota archaeon]|nr:hypothetical protein [Candidatus Pacearchaeota archaeon]
MDENFRQNLKLTLDNIVPLVSIGLVGWGVGDEIYQYIHKFPLGNVPEIVSGFGVLGLYCGFLRRKYLREPHPHSLED